MNNVSELKNKIIELRKEQEKIEEMIQELHNIIDKEYGEGMAMIIRVDRFFPAENGIFKVKDGYRVVMDILEEKGFACIKKEENMIDCVFEKDGKQYKFSNMMYWSSNSKGELGLDIDYITMEYIDKNS